MKRKILSVLLCVSMVAAMAAGCGSSTEDTAADAATTEEAPAEESAETEEAAPAEDTAEADDAAASEGGRTFGYTCMDGTNPFFVALEGAIREVVESNGDTLVSMDPANSFFTATVSAPIRRR